MTTFDLTDLDRYVFRAAQVYSNEVFVFVVEEQAPEGWQPGSDPGTRTYALCYDARLGQWSRELLSHKVGNAVGATGSFPPVAHSSVFVAKANEGEMLAKILYRCSYDKDFSIQQSESISREQIGRVLDAKTIEGTFYFCGNEQTVLRRVGEGQYERISYKSGGRSIRKHEDWFSIDGFSESDIYTTGKDRGNGSLFHYDGEQWRAMLLPPELDGFEGRFVKCLEDGSVLAVSKFGEVVRGRAGEFFEIVLKPNRDDEKNFIDASRIAWFKGKLYGSDLNWLYVMADEKWVPVKSEKGFQPVSFKGLATNGEVLVQYGEYGASFFDGETWYRIYSAVDLDDLVRKDGLEQQLDRLGKGIDILRRLRGGVPK